MIPRAAHHAGSAADEVVVGARKSTSESGMGMYFILDMAQGCQWRLENRALRSEEATVTDHRYQRLLIRPHGDIPLGATENNSAVGSDAECGVSGSITGTCPDY